jgi:hypothetical protein
MLGVGGGGREERFGARDGEAATGKQQPERYMGEINYIQSSGK